jgi:crotonobetainyl-CoA:carnitine CoA-transferase CaiB-like acyl-CoA transferase
VNDGPLDGVRVLDAGRLMPSSIATAELAALGADVIKVEIPPHGDYVRINPPLIDGRGDMHLAINRGKRSISLDLHTESGRQVLDRLVASSDVLVELSRPGAGGAIGLDPIHVRSINPRLVHCSITGFGHTGPYSDLGAHGLSADAAAGLLELERDGDRWLLPHPYVSVGPRASGLAAAIAILGALFKARATGQGSYLDVSQWDAAVSWNYRNLTLSANGAGLAPPYRDLGPKYDAYETADERRVLLCVPEPKLWRAFCQAVGRDDLLERSSDAVIEYLDDDDLRVELRKEFLGRDLAEWLQLGVSFGFPIAPILHAEELTTDPHVLARDMIRTEAHPLGGEVRLPGSPIKGMPPVPLGPAPELGEHSIEVLRAVGYDDEAIDDMVARGVVLTGAAAR